MLPLGRRLSSLRTGRNDRVSFSGATPPANSECQRSRGGLPVLKASRQLLTARYPASVRHLALTVPIQAPLPMPGMPASPATPRALAPFTMPFIADRTARARGLASLLVLAPLSLPARAGDTLHRAAAPVRGR